jgi:glutaminyl-tRNA synthetase
LNTGKLVKNFITDIIDKDLNTSKYGQKVHTRFPPEPNGYLHIGHAKSICLNFGLAGYYNGLCNLRFDDTNPEKEEIEYIESIKEDVRWLGFDWQDRLFYASDYFDRLYEYAVRLIQMGKAYVCDLSPDEIRLYRGSLNSPGKDSPFRGRSIEENVDLFKRMKEGEFDDGARVLRAKIDMAHPNIVMRDPALYRIKKGLHHRTGGLWSIYPMYDFAHCISDSIEGITHSICTLEFENNRPLYDWILEALGIFHPSQIEFARLNLTYTILSKRKLIELVRNKDVSGWDDPRMPTISGLRRRGYTPLSIRTFCKDIGVSKTNSIVDIAVLENSIRQELNKTAPRAMAVLFPLKVTIVNYPEEKEELLDAVNNPEDESYGTRKIPFGRHLYIEKDDFRINPPKKFFRLSPGQEVRLRYAYFIKCEEVIKDEEGNVKELRCTYDPATRGGDSPDGRKPKTTLHWVSQRHAGIAEARLYSHLFIKPDPEDTGQGQNYRDNLNPESLQKIYPVYIEPCLSKAVNGASYQFERQGYFCLDKDSNQDRLVFNRIVGLKDTWSNIEKKQ